MIARSHWIAFAIFAGSIVASHPASAQSASASLTHTLTVTVPPRVRVSIADLAAQREIGTPVTPTAKGLAVSVRATQPWTLSIGSPRQSNVQWSHDDRLGFSSVDENEATIASGVQSQTPISTTVFVRQPNADSLERAQVAQQVFVLTIVAR